MDIEQEIEQLHDAAYAIYRAAALGEEPRDFTADEETRFRDLMDRKKKLEQRRADQQGRRDRLAGFERQLGTVPARNGNGNGQVVPGRTEQFRTIGAQFTEAPQYDEFLRQFPGGVPKGVHVNIPPVTLPARTLTAAIGRKAGEIMLGQYPMPPQWFQWDELMAPWETPFNVLNLVTHTPVTTDAVEYPQLKTWAHAAAVVPEGQAKPQATFDYETITAPVKTYAEWIAVSKQALADRARLRALIDTFLRQGINIRLETDITADLLAQAPAMAAPTGAPTLMDTARLAILSLEKKSVVPTAFLFSPDDQAQLDLAKDEMGRYFSAGPFGMGPQTLWGIRRVTAYRMATPQKAIVGDFRWDVFFDRESDTISASDSHADFFVRNLVAVLGEARGLNAVLYPDAFLQFDTPAPTMALAEAEPARQPEQPAGGRSTPEPVRSPAERHAGSRR